MNWYMVLAEWEYSFRQPGRAFLSLQVCKDLFTVKDAGRAAQQCFCYHFQLKFRRVRNAQQNNIPFSTQIIGKTQNSLIYQEGLACPY